MSSSTSWSRPRSTPPRSQVVAVLSSESRVRDGDTARLWIDPVRLMVFDPETSENLSRDEEAARRVDAETEEERRTALERAQRRESADGERGAA